MKSRKLFNTKTQRMITVHSLSEELQFYASMGYEITAEFIAQVGREWEKVVTDNQKEFLETRKNFSEFLRENQGDYTHAIYQYGTEYLGEISNLDLVRLCILATYSSSSGKCYDKNKNPIKRSSLSTIWDVHRNKVKATYDNLMKAGYITETENGQIVINTQVFKYGKMEEVEMVNKTYSRMFNEKLLGLYHNTPIRTRKQIGMIIRLLPYVNYRYNVLCKNPEAHIKEEIIPLNWMEVCEILGREANDTVTRTKNTLMKFKIDDFSVLGQFSTGSGYHIVINPKVYYAGNNLEDIKHLYTMFNMSVTK